MQEDSARSSSHPTCLRSEKASGRGDECPRSVLVPSAKKKALLLTTALSPKTRRRQKGTVQSRKGALRQLSANNMTCRDNWAQGENVLFCPRYFSEIVVSKDRMSPPACCPQDGWNGAVLPQKHGGSNAANVMGFGLNLEARRVGERLMCRLDGIPEEERNRSL